MVSPLGLALALLALALPWGESPVLAGMSWCLPMGGSVVRKSVASCAACWNGPPGRLSSLQRPLGRLACLRSGMGLGRGLGMQAGVCGGRQLPPAYAQLRLNKLLRAGRRLLRRAPGAATELRAPLICFQPSSPAGVSFTLAGAAAGECGRVVFDRFGHPVADCMSCAADGKSCAECRESYGLSSDGRCVQVRPRACSRRGGQQSGDGACRRAGGGCSPPPSWLHAAALPCPILLTCPCTPCGPTHPHTHMRPPCSATPPAIWAGCAAAAAAMSPSSAQTVREAQSMSWATEHSQTSWGSACRCVPGVRS